jgi:hypothetical protein
LGEIVAEAADGRLEFSDVLDELILSLVIIVYSKLREDGLETGIINVIPR